MQHDHGVTFYDHDGEAIGAIARYVVDGLSAGDRVIVVATDWHVAVLDDLLQLRGTNVREERSNGRYITLNAVQTLNLFMVNGAPDAVLFRRHLGGIIETAGRDGTPVRAFGEMVALLWDDGNVGAALALEALWNELAGTSAFALLCAYPARTLDSASLSDIRTVCGLHSEVGPPLRYTALTDNLLGEGRCEVFLPVAESVAAARNYVARVLERWGEDRLLWAAALVTSELATNAAVGGGSPFRVLIERDDEVIRIAVADVAPGEPQRRSPLADDLHGRGVPIVESLARRWGWDRAGEEKTVWAELAPL